MHRSAMKCMLVNHIFISIYLEIIATFACQTIVWCLHKLLYLDSKINVHYSIQINRRSIYIHFLSLLPYIYISTYSLCTRNYNGMHISDPIIMINLYYISYIVPLKLTMSNFRFRKLAVERMEMRSFVCPDWSAAQCSVPASISICDL